MAEVKTYSLFTEFDIDLFKSGKHYRLYEKFGSHEMTLNKVKFCSMGTECQNYFCHW